MKDSLEVFLGRAVTPVRLRFLCLPRLLELADGFAYPPSTSLDAHPTVRWQSQRRHPMVSLSSLTGDGISTVCPSATPFGLTLGPAKPGRTNLPQETLSFRPERFSLSFSLLVPASSLPRRPGLLTVSLHQRGTLPYHPVLPRDPQLR